MHVLDHTPHTEFFFVELVVASHATNIMLGTNYRHVQPQNGPTLHEHVVQGPCLASRCETIQIHPFVHTHKNELPSHYNCFTLWTTRSHSLGVIPTKTSLTCKYAIINKFRWMSKALLPFGSSSSL